MNLAYISPHLRELELLLCSLLGLRRVLILLRIDVRGLGIGLGLGLGVGIGVGFSGAVVK